MRCARPEPTHTLYTYEYMVCALTHPRAGESGHREMNDQWALGQSFPSSHRRSACARAGVIGPGPAQPSESGQTCECGVTAPGGFDTKKTCEWSEKPIDEFPRQPVEISAK